MNEYLLEAREELKRLEHIIYVSLKYTRTVDVIINALKLIISTYDFIIEAYLIKAKEEERISSLAKSPALRAKHLSELYPDDKELEKYLTFYHFLKTVLKLHHRKREEFRRHVTLIVDLDRCTAEIDIDNLVNCEKFTHGFYTFAVEALDGA